MRNKTHLTTGKLMKNDKYDSAAPILSRFFNRDLSWLSFNERVLDEAGNEHVPLFERLKFLSIFSSNLDEFCRVRLPALRAMKKIGNEKINNNDPGHPEYILRTTISTIDRQQIKCGNILCDRLIPLFKDIGISILYNEAFPDSIINETTAYFVSQILAFIKPVELRKNNSLFLSNNKLYFVVDLLDKFGKARIFLLNIPSSDLPRFFSAKFGTTTYIAFLDDIIRFNLDKIFSGCAIKGCYAIKLTRDAELDLKDEYRGDVSKEIEKQLKKRDFGLATRFLYQTGLPETTLQLLVKKLQLDNANITAGGNYHNLKDFFSLPVSSTGALYDAWPAINPAAFNYRATLSDQINDKDVLINTPYQSYTPVLRFFNEAAINPNVTEIYVTLYRVANDSKIANALMSAAGNGKKVQVIIELKARFDEANNLEWAQLMKQAGVRIIYSITSLKVHAKIALVKTKKGDQITCTGMLATGNFNEQTARFYTDHILFTANPKLMQEMEKLFEFLARREKPSGDTIINFKHLLVAQFNLQNRFIKLIDQEILNAKHASPAGIILKMNNLEEKVLINKLYEASQAGVKISLIVRGICCLSPGVEGLSEHITVRRIVDRYLEHGRVFIFHNNGDPAVYLGSADWMERNIHRRIEVCFPVYDKNIKDEILNIISLQLADNIQAVTLNEKLENIPVARNIPEVQSQKEIYQMLKNI